eukprot:2999747-Alexandrium_andersonii.AAC.1
MDKETDPQGLPHQEAQGNGEPSCQEPHGAGGSGKQAQRRQASNHGRRSFAARCCCSWTAT